MSESAPIAPADDLDGIDDMLEAEPQPLPVHEGDVIAGKYRLDKLIGVGGMAAVLRATHLELEQAVAIKILRPEHVSRPEAVKRFLREARAAVRLRSSNVARVLDVGTAEVSAALSIPFMVMELLEGNDFETLLETHGRFETEDAVEYILQACDAVGEAHALGIIHRDLKPANLFLTTRRDGTPLVKLLDFGISKMRRTGLTSDNQKITQEHAMMGSPAYMSPEQVRSTKDVDERADIWSLGAILYELLGGREPWSGETSADTFSMILNEPPAPLRALAPDVPPALEEVVLRCLAKEKTARFQSIGELANALAPFVPRRSLSVMPTWETSSGPSPSSQGIVAAFESRRLALQSVDSQRLLTPVPMQAFQPAPASSPPRSIPAKPLSLRPKAAPWWHLPAILGGLVGVVGIVLVLALVGFRAKREAHASTIASAATRPAASAPTAPVVSVAPSAAAPNTVASASASPIATTHAAAPAAKPRPAYGIPRHRTDW